MLHKPTFPRAQCATENVSATDHHGHPTQRLFLATAHSGSYTSSMYISHRAQVLEQQRGRHHFYNAKAHCSLCIKIWSLSWPSAAVAPRTQAIFGLRRTLDMYNRVHLMKSYTPHLAHHHQRFKALICDKIDSQQNYVLWAVQIFLCQLNLICCSFSSFL